MNIEIIPAYLNLESYIKEKHQTKETWKKNLIEPYWHTLSQWAPDIQDYKMPIHPLNKEEAKHYLKIMNGINWEHFVTVFQNITDLLPKEEEDTLYVAIYPSNTLVPEGIYGTGVWGNIILNINPANDNYKKWIPFIFAHEYHHSVWGNYWYCLQQGKGLYGWVIEHLLIEGEADAFAQSIYKDMEPSWHNGVKADEEEITWAAFLKVAQKCLQPKEMGKYMFGCEELKIPKNAGYYFGNRMIKEYMRQNNGINMVELLETPLSDIYNYYQL